MCGICGVVHPTQSEAIERDQLVHMRDVMTHRGPDEAGMLQKSHVAFGHRRLSIIDLSPAGRQPMSNEDESVWMICNGEIYNYREIRAELIERGHRFNSGSDNEILVHLYEEMGEKLVDRLRGMFAFAIWDVAKQKLLLARDRFGIKPVYYSLRDDGRLIFGSEIKVILASGFVDAKPSAAGVSEYLANRYTTGSDTMFEGVSRLLPGHTALWHQGRVDVRRYWTPPAGHETDTRSETELVNRFTELFEESIELRMISDAPIGVFLSGGIDSSAIATVMAERSSTPIRSFSVAFEERGANELPFARLVAESLGAVHREVVVKPDEYFEVLEKLIWHEDEPIAFPSSIPLYFVSKLAESDVKVVLTGEGSDEMFAGYGKYWRALYNLQVGNAYEHLPSALRGAIRNGVNALPKHRISNRLRRTFLTRPSNIESLYLQNFSVFDRAMQLQALTPAFQDAARNGSADFDPFVGHRTILEGLSHLPLLDQLLVLDWQTYLHELLMKQDQMSMAASIESRVPFLDQELAAFAATLPQKMKLKGLTTKRILRLAMEKRLPPAILKRSKMGFPTPFGAWLRDRPTIIDDVVLSESARSRGILQFDYIEKVVKEHRAGAVDHTERLWALTNLELWFRNCVDVSSAQPSHS